MEKIRHALSNYQPQQLAQQEDKQASVALLLRPGEQGVEMLFMQRARHPRDPWSGNLSFPGGGIEPSDAGPLAAAIRETEEEVGLYLSEEQLIGQLDDRHGSRVPIQVSCYVFIVDTSQKICSNEEVARSFWFPITELQQRQRHGMHQVDWHGKILEVPAISISTDLPILWGLTYRFVRQFLHLIGTPLDISQVEQISQPPT
ncbi:MAG: CoA pyrophosphatase [Desulfuromonas sp.]|nr:CoA pyrophosphatase [Desulfuromonas sp.]